MAKNAARGARVRQAMQRAGLTVEKLAQTTGLAHGTISGIRQGADFKTWQLEILCQQLQITASELMGDSDLHQDELPLLHHYRQLSPAQRQWAVQLLAMLAQLPAA